MKKIFVAKKRIESSIFSHHFSLKYLLPLPYLTSINDATVKLSIIWFRVSNNCHQEFRPANYMNEIETGCTFVSVAEHAKFDPFRYVNGW